MSKFLKCYADIGYLPESLQQYLQSQESKQAME